MHAVVTQATVDRAGPISEMYSRAFLDEPLLRWPLGAVADPLAVIEAEFCSTNVIAAAHGCLWEVGDAQAGAGWISPQAAETYWNELMLGTRGVIAHAIDGGLAPRQAVGVGSRRTTPPSRSGFWSRSLSILIASVAAWGRR